MPKFPPAPERSPSSAQENHLEEEVGISWESLLEELADEETASATFIAKARNGGSAEEADEMEELLKEIGVARKTWMERAWGRMKESLPASVRTALAKREEQPEVIHRRIESFVRRVDAYVEKYFIPAERLPSPEVSPDLLITDRALIEEARSLSLLRKRMEPIEAQQAFVYYVDFQKHAYEKNFDSYLAKVLMNLMAHDHFDDVAELWPENVGLTGNAGDRVLPRALRASLDEAFLLQVYGYSQEAKPVTEWVTDDRRERYADYLEARFCENRPDFFTKMVWQWSGIFLSTPAEGVSVRHSHIIRRLLGMGQLDNVEEVIDQLFQDARLYQEESKTHFCESFDPNLLRDICRTMLQAGKTRFLRKREDLFEKELASLNPEQRKPFLKHLTEELIEALNEPYFDGPKALFGFLCRFHLHPEEIKEMKDMIRRRSDEELAGKPAAETGSIPEFSLYHKFLHRIAGHVDFFHLAGPVLFGRPSPESEGQTQVHEEGDQVQEWNHWSEKRRGWMQDLVDQGKTDEVVALLLGEIEYHGGHERAWAARSGAGSIALGHLLTPSGSVWRKKFFSVKPGSLGGWMNYFPDEEDVRRMERAYLVELADKNDMAMYREVFFRAGRIFWTFDSLTAEAEQRFLTCVLANGEDKDVEDYLEKKAKSANKEGLCIEAQAIQVYQVGGTAIERGALREYIKKYIQEGRDAADAYLQELRERAKGILGEEVPRGLRSDPGYLFMCKHVFPSGNYSTHEKNLACGDRLEHLDSYVYDKQGYAVELSGLLGYRLRTETDEITGVVRERRDDRALFARYQSRFEAINHFVTEQGPNNELLQKRFDARVAEIFDQQAMDGFKRIPELNMKEKMLALFVGEAVRRERDPGITPNEEVLDLIVLYKYAYHENLEAYVQRSAGDARQYQDETSQRYVMWQELSTIYGENLKHVLRHNIFEDLAENGKNYTKIVEAFGTVISLSSEGFEVGGREMKQIETVFQKKMPEEQRYSALMDKLVDLFGPQDKSKGDEGKRAAYEAERALFVARMDEALRSSRDELSAERVREVVEATFPMPPRQLKRFEATFENEQIPREDRWIERPLKDGGTERKLQDGKYKVLLKQCLDVFGSNIQFQDKDEENDFRAAVATILEPVKETLDKEGFIQLVPRLRTLRNQYRFRINARLEALFAVDVNAINTEVAKFEEIIEVEAKEDRIGGPKDREVKKSVKKRKIRSFFTKTQETANARMGAYLCVAGDAKMWENENYFELVDKDEETGKCVGVTMLMNIEADNGKRYVWMGPNPFESFLTQVSAEKAFQHQYATVVDFAKQNGYDGVVIPSEDGQILGACTNRGGTFPDLIKAKRLRDKKGGLRVVPFGKRHTLGLSYGYQDGALVWEKQGV